MYSGIVVFIHFKSDKEVNEMQATGISQKTKEDTEYCMRIWNAWSEERIAIADSGDEKIPPLLQMNKEMMQHWLTCFILEVKKKDGSEYPPNTLYHIVCVV